MSVAFLRSTASLVRAIALDLAIVIAWMMPAVIIPQLPPAGAALMLALGLAAFLQLVRRPGFHRGRSHAISARPPRCAQLPPLVVAALLLGVAELFVEAWLYRATPGPRDTPTWNALDAYALRPHGAMIVNMFLIVYVPIVEEFVFRRRMLGRLRERFSAPVALGLSTVIFTVVHLDLWASAFVLATGGIFAIVALRTGTVWTAVLLHGVTNAVAPALALLVGSDIRVDRWLDTTGLARGSQAMCTVIAMCATALVLRHLVRLAPVPPDTERAA